MLPEGCEFKSRTLELEEITGNSQLMRRRILLRAYFLGFQDDKDPNCHCASPVMPTSCMSREPALTSCLDSPPATARPAPWAFSCFWRTASHPRALLTRPPRAELLSPIPCQESRAHSLQLLSLSRHICLVPKSSCGFLLWVFRAPRTFPS